MSYKYIREIQLKYQKKRVSNSDLSDRPIKSASQIYQLFQDLQNDIKEKLIVIVLDEQYKIIIFEVVALGIIESVYAMPAEVFRSAIIARGHGFILVHNHPDGSIKPSKDDSHFTKVVKRESAFLGIELLDHVIIGNDGFFSYKENGRLK